MAKGAKSSYDLLVKENIQLKEYIINIKQRLKQYQQQQEFLQDKEYFQRPQKRYRKSIHTQGKKQPQNKRKNKILDYLNKDAKRNKR